MKLIDVAPDNAELSPWSPDGGPLPGQFARSANGYQLPIAMEVRRGRYLESNEHPKALPPNKPLLWTVPLRDRNHVFKAGHRVMVQIQSTWFPLIDRNPQKFVPNIFAAKDSDFQSATQKVFRSSQYPSGIVLPVVSSVVP